MMTVAIECMDEGARGWYGRAFDKSPRQSKCRRLGTKTLRMEYLIVGS